MLNVVFVFKFQTFNVSSLQLLKLTQILLLFHVKLSTGFCILGTSQLGARLSEREERMTSRKI